MYILSNGISSNLNILKNQQKSVTYTTKPVQKDTFIKTNKLQNLNFTAISQKKLKASSSVIGPLFSTASQGQNQLERLINDVISDSTKNVLRKAATKQWMSALNSYKCYNSEAKVMASASIEFGNKANEFAQTTNEVFQSLKGAKINKIKKAITDQKQKFDHLQSKTENFSARMNNYTNIAEIMLKNLTDIKPDYELLKEEEKLYKKIFPMYKESIEDTKTQFNEFSCKFNNIVQTEIFKDPKLAEKIQQGEFKPFELIDIENNAFIKENGLPNRDNVRSSLDELNKFLNSDTKTV